MAVAKPPRSAPGRRPARTPRNDPLVREVYLHLLGERPHTTASLARVLKVSTATVSRAIQALRKDLARRGMVVVSVRTGRSWRLGIDWKGGVVRVDWNDPFFRLRGIAKGVDPRKGLSDDEIVYGE